jgi:nucleoside-diphosphate kinase
MKGRVTFTMIKPGAVANEHIGQILHMINEKGFHIQAMKLVELSRREAESFYSVHKEKPFFQELVHFMTSGPIVAAILEKENAVEDYRKLIGATNPDKAEPGTIRKLYAESIQKNAVHGSDSDENAEKEASFFFSQSERFPLSGIGL